MSMVTGFIRSSRGFSDELIEQLAGCRALGHRSPLGRATDDLPNDGEVPNVDVPL